MESDEKKCPQCAEVVKAEARVCRHCNFNFDTGSRPSDSPPEPKKKMGVFGCIGLIVVIVIVLAVLGTFGGGDKSTTANIAPSNVAPTVVTASELAAAYESNEAAAQQQYGDRPLQVTGTVTAVTLDFSDDPVVQLAGVNQFQSVHAALAEASKPKASSVSKGQSVTVTCASVSEVIGTPMLKDCELP